MFAFICVVVTVLVSVGMFVVYQALLKIDWEGFAKSVDMGITDIVPTPDNYGSFVDLVKKSSRQNRTSYICGLTEEPKELYEDYKMQFENDPFNSETTDTGNGYPTKKQ